jgi:hypothetical protein
MKFKDYLLIVALVVGLSGCIPSLGGPDLVGSRIDDATVQYTANVSGELLIGSNISILKDGWTPLEACAYTKTAFDNPKLAIKCKAPVTVTVVSEGIVNEDGTITYGSFSGQVFNGLVPVTLLPVEVQ